MKIFRRDRAGENLEWPIRSFNTGKGYMDLLKEMENKEEKAFCTRCGYVDCVCTQNIAQERF